MYIFFLFFFYLVDPALSFVLRKKIKVYSQNSTNLAKYDLILSHCKFSYNMSKAQYGDAHSAYISQT